MATQITLSPSKKQSHDKKTKPLQAKRVTPHCQIVSWRMTNMVKWSTPLTDMVILLMRGFLPPACPLDISATPVSILHPLNWWPNLCAVTSNGCNLGTHSPFACLLPANQFNVSEKQMRMTQVCQPGQHNQMQLPKFPLTPSQIVSMWRGWRHRMMPLGGEIWMRHCRCLTVLTKASVSKHLKSTELCNQLTSWCSMIHEHSTQKHNQACWTEPFLWEMD